MLKFLDKIFEELKIPAYYITRKKQTFPCVVYNFYENKGGSSDDNEEFGTYTITVDIYHPNNFIETKEQVKELMKKYNFDKKIFGIPLWMDNLKCYQVPMHFSFSEEIPNIEIE